MNATAMTETAQRFWRARFAVVGAALIVLPTAATGPAQAQLVNENLLVRMPDGYKVDYQKKSGRMLISEMVPKTESVKEWTEMVTVQIFFGEAATAEQFMERIRVQWVAACTGASARPLSAVAENGYASTMWTMSCPLNPTTGKPEHTWFKAVRGNDSLYVVQKAFRFKPSDQQLAPWLNFLARVSVCDSRIPERACALSRN